MFPRYLRSYSWFHGNMVRCRNYISFSFPIFFVQFWTMDSPEHYKWNWQCNFRQKWVIFSQVTYSFSHCLWQWVFQRCDKLADLKCNYWFCTAYENNSWTIHLIFFPFSFHHCNQFSRPPIVGIVQGDCENFGQI